MMSLQYITMKNKVMKELISRNEKHKCKKYIRFPFLVIEPSSLDNTDINYRPESSLKKMAVYSNNSMTIYGDLDFIAEFPNIADNFKRKKNGK